MEKGFCSGSQHKLSADAGGGSSLSVPEGANRPYIFFNFEIPLRQGQSGKIEQFFLF
jgi:hypothetical protein